MKSRFAIVICLFAAAVGRAQQTAPPSADEVVRRSIEMMAGTAWPTARYISFTFNLDRAGGPRVASFPQRWDRATGDYRVSGLDPQGKKFEVIMNIKTKQGKAWIDGAPITGDKLAQAIQLGEKRFVNDIFWLLMPLKMLDPGVHRAYAGSRDDACGHTWDMVQLKFDPAVSIGPNDVYWAWINRDTGLVDYWDMKLTGAPADDPPVAVALHDYRRVGGLLISTRREAAAKKQIVRLDDLQILAEPPKGAFE